MKALPEAASRRRFVRIWPECAGDPIAVDVSTLSQSEESKKPEPFSRPQMGEWLTGYAHFHGSEEANRKKGDRGV
jgi:hypothetical protein